MQPLNNVLYTLDPEAKRVAFLEFPGLHICLTEEEEEEEED
jgi:hypothetical protein